MLKGVHKTTIKFPGMYLVLKYTQLHNLTRYRRPS